MKINNINKIEEYPDNYDDIPKEKQKIILTYFNDEQALADSYYEKHILQQEMRPEYLNLYDHVMDLLCGGKNILSLLGIKVEYNWPSCPGKWILATKKDAEYFNDYQEKECECAKEELLGYNAWPTPKGGRWVKKD